MSFTTLISTQELAAHLTDPNWVVVDCRFALNDAQIGPKKYDESHLPGARYANLNQDLASPPIPGVTGRHPLPSVEELIATFSRWGIDERVQVVAYDDAGGLYAGRLWWLLRWLGHDAVALLDGDFRAWLREGRPVTSIVEPVAPRHFVARPRPDREVSVEQVLAHLHDPTWRLLDARSADRYCGENESIDPRAGHIPGAQSAFFGANLDANSYFLPAEQLRERFNVLLDDAEPAEAVVYCGSGVSAAHNLLAMEHAGLPGARLFVGSWSQWIADPARPIV